MTTPLRADVRIALGPDGAGALEDTTLGRRIKLDAQGVALCRGLGQAAEVIAASIGTTSESVQRFADRLVALDLCATPRAALRVAERKQLAAVQAAPAKHLKMLPNARFTCTMCGSCCGGHNVGPVSESVLDGLEDALPALAEVVRAARHMDKDLFVALPGSGPPSGTTGGATPGKDVVCHASNGSCVFLDDTGKCRIHASLGGEAKPLPCRIFPWELVATPTGVRVSVQRECRDFVRATDASAPPLEASLDEVMALVSALDTLPTARTIPVVAGRELDSWAAWEAIEARWFAIADATDAASGADPIAIFCALRDALGEGATSATPSRPEAFAAWRIQLVNALSRIAKAAPPADERMLIRVDALRILLQTLEHAHGWTLARALAPLEGAAAALFQAHLRHALWATTPLRAKVVEAGLGRLVAEWVLARLVAVVRAREVKRFHVTEQDLQDGLVTASFLFRHDDLQPVLAELDALTVAVFVDGLEHLAAVPATEPDRRFELVKF